MTTPKTAAQRMCDKGGTLHHLAAHGTDGHEHAHNPWSERCVRRLRVESWCPDARCMTCDGDVRRA